MWWNDYVGIPYDLRGRDRSGIDCWGLVRLVYKEQFNIDLPSFSEKYEDDSNSDQFQELLATQREGWVNVQDPKVGDVVLMRVLGLESHIGIYIGEGKFLHAKRDTNAVIESLDSLRWKKRVIGFYRYMPNHATLSAIANPLKTERIDGLVDCTKNLIEIQKSIKEHKDHEDGIFMVDGRIIPKDEWAVYIPKPGSRVEYRALIGDDDLGRAVTSIALVYVAIQFGPEVATFFTGTEVAAGTAAAAAGSAAITIAGSLLLNRIFPVRTPELPQGMSLEIGKSQITLQGGTNEATPYSSIPIVLGTFRYSPPLGAVTYVESLDTNQYLRMLLVWGYGPMNVQNIRIGDVAIDSYEEVTYATINDYGADSGAEITLFNNLYGKDVSQDFVNIELTSDGTNGGSPWREQVISDLCSQFQISISFPEGLRQMPLDGADAGKVEAAQFLGEIQYRQLDPDTLAPLTAWADPTTIFSQTSLQFSSTYLAQSDSEGTYYQPGYQLLRITIDSNGNIKKYTGALSGVSGQDPTGIWLTSQQNQTSGFNATYLWLPPIPSNETEIYRITLYGNEISDTTAYNTGIITGGTISYVVDYYNINATIAAGTINRGTSYTIDIGTSTSPYEKRKDGFVYTKTFNLPLGKYEVRVRRLNNSEADFTYGSGAKGYKYHKAVFLAVTGFENTSPVVAPKNTQLCMTAIRIKATDQINGQVDSIAGTVQSVCLDYNSGTNTWVLRPTNNPASLMRYVLQHPANAQKVADAKINLTALAEWHTFCATNFFTFDMVLLNQRSVYEVLKDICAAGRASPTLVDGKWSVIIDKPQSTVAQYFTPHNSWGFQSQKSIPILPHAFRVAFNNALKGYQPDEYIVYNDGYTSSNATLFESLALPGVTNPTQIFKHARFHLAQLKLRPEIYSLNVDIENLICTRGDLVRVTHDIPLWGLGTGRIKNYVTSTRLELDTPVPMVASTQYTIRIRLADGSSVTRTVASQPSDGEYSIIDLTTSLTSTEGAAGNLFMFGSLSDESNLLVVQSIEPMQNMTARLTLIDYSPAVYTSDDEPIPEFDSNITRPPLLQRNKITQSPTIGTIVSDESVLVRLGPGKYEYRIKVNFTNPVGLSSTITNVEAQLDFANDNIVNWQNSAIATTSAKSVFFGDVQEGSTYKIRLRYINGAGQAGPWVYSSNHTVVGKSNPPSQVGTATLTVEGSALRLDWPDNPEPDIEFYEVRTSNTGWGDTDRVFKGLVSNCLVTPAAAGTSRTWYIKAIDGSGNYSVNARSITYTASAPGNPVTITHEFADTSLTNATVTIDWSDVLPVFGLEHYKISYDSVVKTIKASSITLPADWLGSRTFTIKTVDLLGNESSGYAYAITKLAPASPVNFRSQVIDNTVMLFWDLPTKTSLPIDHVLLKRGATWATATIIGEKKGTFTTIDEYVAGTYTYWAATIDTDDNESAPVSLSAIVSEPPDFVFYGDFVSTLSGTKSSAISQNGSVLLPVNTTETWSSHFTARSWTSPQAQVTAGYPIFIQPANGTGYYEETFTNPDVLASSQVIISYTGTTISGSVTVKSDISVSLDNITYTTYEATQSVFASNFKYVKVKLTITETTGTGLYLLNSLAVRLDAKLKNDAGTVSALSTDANGTIVNFNKEFVDVSSIVVSPSGTTAITAVYDFKDALLSATYSVTSNVCTVTYTSHGFITGQKVRLQFSSGNGVPGVYTITGTTTNTFTVAMVVANTSGNCTIYAESFRIYLFNSSGTRVSATASWSIKGY